MRILALSAVTIAFAGAPWAIEACGGTDKSGPAEDAAFEAAPSFDASMPPSPDAQPPAGDVCGDARGLSADSPWPLAGGCPKRAGVAKAAGPQNAVVKWRTTAPAGATSPAIDGAHLPWVGTADGDVLVFAVVGAVQSSLHTGGAVRSSPAVAQNGTVVVGGGDGVLYGVLRGTTADAGGDAGDADAGDDAAAAPVPAHVVFQLAVAPMASSPVIGADGTIYVGTTDGKLVATLSDGSAVKWRATTGDTSGSSPAIARDGTIYVGSSDGHLYALDAGGSVKWSYDAASPVASPAVGGDETVYVGAADGTLHAVTPDGKNKWKYATGGPIAGAPAVLAGVVYVGSADKSLHAVGVTDGKRRWLYTTLGPVATPSLGKDGTIYVGSGDGHLYAITPGGSLFFAVNVRGAVTTAPAIADDGTLYLTTSSDVLAIGP
jgi:outer membrane protein assembly factor BamB